MSVSVGALFVFFVTAFIIVYFINIPSHIKRTKKFYDTIDEMIDNYYTIYPKKDPSYFYNIVEPENVTMWKVWITDYNKFILDQEKLKELFKGNKKFLESEKNSVNLYCPWCGNNETEKFYFAPYVKDKSKGFVICLECKSASPPGVLEEGVFTFDKNEKLEKHNEKI